MKELLLEDLTKTTLMLKIKMTTSNSIDTTLGVTKTFFGLKVSTQYGPKNEHGRTRGCNVVSKCSPCGLTNETSIHIFVQCPFAVKSLELIIFYVTSHVLS